MKYSVVIPTYNHCDDLLRPCIESIIKYTNIADIELIISANGCTDNTKEYLDELKTFFYSRLLLPNLKIVWDDSPLGYPKAVNNGIKVATCDKIVLLNNDCILLEQSKNKWLDLLDDPFSDPNCGITCVVKEYSKIIRQEFAIFFCVMIDRRVFDRIGLLNEDYETGSCEDMEFCVLAQNARFTIKQALEKQQLDNKYFTGQFPIYHLGEGTVHDQSLVSNWKNTFLKNSFKVAKKFNSEWNSMKKSNPHKIAVITPTFNSIDLLQNAIDYVKSQTVDNVIHYIYDDNSSDNTGQLLEELSKIDSSIVYLKGTENLGQSNARNVAIFEALNNKCEYIAFLDADDVWNNNHLEDSIQHLNESDVVYSTPHFVTERNEYVRPYNITIPNIFIGKQLRHNNFIWISSVVASAKCFMYNSFDSRLDSIEDWDMWLRLFEQGYKFHKKDKTTIRYLVRDNTEASKGSSKMELFKQKHNVLEKLKLHLACGHDYNPDYINVDLYAPETAKTDVRFDVQKLPYDDNTIDEIKAFHIIEHFHFFEIQEILKEWYRVLKPGGRLYLETPDFLETCKAFVEADEPFRIALYGHFFAHPWVPGQTHKFLFTENQLRINLGWAGFKLVNRLPPASNYVMPNTVKLFLTVEAIK